MTKFVINKIVKWLTGGGGIERLNTIGWPYYVSYDEDWTRGGFAINLYDARQDIKLWGGNGTIFCAATGEVIE